MVVQVTFFLHLGRGPKPKWNLFFFIATIGIVILVVGGSIVIIDNLHYNMSPSDQSKKLVNDEGIYQINGEKTGACEGQHENHQVTIKNSKATPLHTLANKCDTLTFINEDDMVRDIAFGSHPAHNAYAGESELIVRKGKNKTITLSESGSYQFHDHLQPDMAGEVTIMP
jgi:plastocyanin